jgi:ribosome-binding factor A
MSKQAMREQRGGDRSARSPRATKEPEAAGHRHERLSRLLREEIEAVVRDELADPRLEGVRITTVELSVDYKNARVGFIEAAGVERHERERLERLLERATPFLRRRLADALDLKQVPLLRFAWDAYAAAAPDETA